MKEDQGFASLMNQRFDAIVPILAESWERHSIERKGNGLSRRPTLLVYVCQYHPM